MQEQMKQQHVPVKVYRTRERLMVTAPMPGLEPKNMVVEVTESGRLILHGDLRGMLKGVKELLIDEWSVGVYHRELALSAAVNGELANVTYGNGVLTVTLPVKYPMRKRRGFYAVAGVGSFRASVFFPSARMLTAALTSRSISAPHSQECQRSSSVFLRTAPQLEQT
jgi:HSP20 family protein